MHVGSCEGLSLLKKMSSIFLKTDLDLSVTRDDPASPVVVALSSNRVAINFQEDANSEKVPIIVAR
jgi:hypothetical protein